jgi:hypothetical protein
MVLPVEETEILHWWLEQVGVLIEPFGEVNRFGEHWVSKIVLADAVLL